jgi:hypothetical protein
MLEERKGVLYPRAKTHLGSLVSATVPPWTSPSLRYKCREIHFNIRRMFTQPVCQALVLQGFPDIRFNPQSLLVKMVERINIYPSLQQS